MQLHDLGPNASCNLSYLLLKEIIDMNASLPVLPENNTGYTNFTPFTHLYPKRTTMTKKKGLALWSKRWPNVIVACKDQISTWFVLSVKTALSK